MDNKQVIQKLVDYYVTQDPAMVARALANALVDFNRFANLPHLPDEERECLFARLKANCDELQDFIANGPRCDLKLHNTQTAEETYEMAKRTRR
jgi:hypothetical protein